jgi:hypothetical protein
MNDPLEYRQAFEDSVPKTAAESGPVYFLWVFDPQNDEVHVLHNENRHPAEAMDHSNLAERVPHPDRIHGYAYRIVGGFRITDESHRPVADPHVKRLVENALTTA